MKERSEVDPKDTWNLQDLYSSDKECLTELERIGRLAAQIAEMQGRVTSSAEALLEVLKLSDALGIAADRACTYIRLLFDSDMGETSAKELFGRMQYLLTDIGEKTAFLEPELLAMDPETFQDYCLQCPDLTVYTWSMTKL
ncbi:MAG: hypothetical protein FWH28_09320, partial [Clostridiales bacterium]|nr:hypothetical protein [Clostridiales bacterium]